MKQVRKYLLVMFCVVACVVNAQTTVSWDYPIKPGTEAWDQCRSAAEIHEKLNIPDPILKALDTESLVQICLDYPATTVFFCI